MAGQSSPLGGNTGINKTRNAICSRFNWYGMSVDIKNWILECDKCQKVGKPLTAVQTFECIKVSAVWKLVEIDLTGPFPKTTDGYQYILTATDYFSKWVKAFSLKEICCRSWKASLFHDLQTQMSENNSVRSRKSICQ